MWGFGSLGCAGPQSALAPAGRDAAEAMSLTVGMSAAGAVLWLAVLLVGAAAFRRRPADPARAGARLVAFGGVIVPAVLLVVLLAVSLPALPRALAEGSGPVVRVTALQYWWRVVYVAPDGAEVELADELHLPVGERTTIRLDSPDVIHSLWIPSLAGKRDAIPGRVTTLALEPTEPAVLRGACAEYCGLSHARMALWAVAEPPEAFRAWLAHQAAPARPPADDLAREGLRVFLAVGCAACHAIRGTDAGGRAGPDLTHVGGRRSLGAATLGTDRADFRAFLVDVRELKPGVHMPAYGHLADRELDALAALLDGLE